MGFVVPSRQTELFTTEVLSFLTTT